MTTALYLRTSTDTQTTANQLPALQRLAAARDLGLPAVYEDQAASGIGDRPQLARLLNDARKGNVHSILVWAIDRLGRNVHEVVATILELDHLNVRLISHSEPWLDTSGPVRSLLIYVFSWVAEQERSRLVERTKSGMSRAKSQGKTIGRPRIPLPPPLLAQVQELRTAGTPWRAVAAQGGVSDRTLRRGAL